MSEVRFSPGELDRGASFFVAGHCGLVGSALVRKLEGAGFENLQRKTSKQLDLRERDAVFEFLTETRPRYIALAAAKVGGIFANHTYPVDFLSDNVRIQVNVMDAAAEVGVERLLYIGSSCIYPKFAPQPIREDYLLTGELESTNKAFAIAKIAGVLQVSAVRQQYGLPWISVMAASLYGPHDNFSPTGSHMLPALIRRYDEASKSGVRSVTNWGTGNPRREFLYVDDLADACLYLLENYDSDEHINVGTGIDSTIREIAAEVASAVGYDGATEWDHTKPDGTPRKLLDVTRLQKTGWSPAVSLREGIERTLRWYHDNSVTLRR